MWRAKGQSDASFGTGGHELCGSANVPAEADDAVEIVKWDAQLAYAFMAYFDCLAIFEKPRAFKSNEERIEMLHHDDESEV